MSAHQMAEVVDDSDVALTLVIEEDPTSAASMWCSSPTERQTS